MIKRTALVALALFVVACGGEDGEKCTPECDGKACGEDGCEGFCGECSKGSVCLEGECFACDPAANCAGRQCGPDGCGGSCGKCTDNQVCDDQVPFCVELPEDCEPGCNNSGAECGPDGCGEDCGECEPGFICQHETYTCKGKCTPSCAGLSCGADGCGGVCGECGSGEICDVGVCIMSSALPPDDFKVLFGYQGRIPGTNDDEHDLYLVNADGSNPVVPGELGPQALTGFSLQEASGCQLILAEDDQGNPTEYGPCSCNFGCLVDRSLQWIAVSVKKPTATGFTFQLGRFDAELHVAMVKGIFMKEIIDFKFAGNYLYYSRQSYCDGAHCQYQISRVQLDPVDQPEDLLIFPPENDPDWPKHSDYKGHFKVSQDGSVMVILGTTIRSVRLYMWKAGNLHELDYICNHLVNGDCIGAGSEYTDTDPVAISADNSKILAFTAAERDLRVRVYDTGTLEQKYLNLFSVPSGTYHADACKYLLDPVWEFKNVIGDPRFSPDGKSVYFIANDDCNVISSMSKVRRNILMMDIASIGDGTPFAQGDFINITNNPPGDGPENIVVESFDLSASGKTIAFTGTPGFEFVGDPADPVARPLAEDSNRARKDSEIWLVGTSGAGLTQLTDDKKFAGKSPLMLDSSVTQYYNDR